MTPDEVRRLENVQAELARLAGELRRLEAERDTLLRSQLDGDGCHDRRPTGMR